MNTRLPLPSTAGSVRARRTGRPGALRRAAMLLALAGFAAAAATTASAQTIYRWTDETGKVHYGDKVPDRYQSRATEVTVKDPMPPSESRPRAPEGSGGPSSIRPAASAPVTPAAPPGAQGLTVPGGPGRAGPLPTTGPGSACAQQWQSYQASGACFAPYRNVNGSIKAEAFQNCKEVQRPSCTP